MSLGYGVGETDAVHRRKEVISMAEKPFKDREEVKKEIGKFSSIGLFDSGLGLLFAIIGIIADALDRSLILEPTSWLLLAIFFGILGASPIVKSAVAKSLYGIESESKQK